jgi:hypothetical protein
VARIRTIKPEFFTSEDIVGLPPFARLLYIALWCEADKEGRFAWKPNTFKMRYLPADEVNIFDLCDALVHTGLVVLYGNGLAYIPTFNDHQHINPRERASTLPPPNDASATRQPRVSDDDDTLREEGKGKEGKEGKEYSSADAEASATASEADGDLEDGLSACPHKKIIALYHEVLPMCPRVRDWTPARAAQLRARWNEDESRQTLDYWRRFFEYVAACDFLVGKGKAKDGNAPFMVDLEWLVKQANFVKVRERKYEPRT